MIILLNNRKLDRGMMRQNNLSLILRLLKEKGPLSKTDLSKITKLTLPSITDILSELEEADLVRTIGHAPTKRGRFPVIYQLHSNSFYIVGVTIRSESIKSVLINLNGDILDSYTIPLPANRNQDHVLQEVGSFILQTIDNSEVDKQKVLGVGIGMHGVVDPVNGIAIFPPHLGWKNVAIRDMLEVQVDLPVFIDNDCNTLALAERWFGEKMDTNSFIVLNVDYGIGAGIMIDGELFHGSNYGGGQIGHITVDSNGPICRCGNYGCLETLASESAVINMISKKIKQGYNSIIPELVNHQLDSITLHHIYDAAKANDELAKQSLEEIGRYLGIGIVSLINLFNPQQLVITGNVLKGKDFIIQPLKDTVFKKALNTNTKDLLITTSNLGNYSDAMGAATLWIDALFNGKIKINELISTKESI